MKASRRTSCLKISSCCASLSCATGGRLPWGIARKCGRSGSKQAKHLIFGIVFSPSLRCTQPAPLPEGAFCNFLLDISRTVRYIIRYNAVRKSARRFRLFQQAGGDASPAWPAVCCRFQAGAVKLSSRARVCRRYPGRRGVCPAAKRPFTRQLGWYRDLNFSGRPMIFFMGRPFLLITRPAILKEVLHNAKRTRQTVCAPGH